METEMEFTKMQGTGNDYVYVDCFKETVRAVSYTHLDVYKRQTGQYLSDSHNTFLLFH